MNTFIFCILNKNLFKFIQVLIIYYHNVKFLIVLYFLNKKHNILLFICLIFNREILRKLKNHFVKNNKVNQKKSGRSLCRKLGLGLYVVFQFFNILIDRNDPVDEVIKRHFRRSVHQRFDPMFVNAVSILNNNQVVTQFQFIVLIKT